MSGNACVGQQGHIDEITGVTSYGCKFASRHFETEHFETEHFETEHFETEQFKTEAS